MKAPKRTPWANQVELEELYEMLFAPSADVESRKRGIARMSIYISSPSCPTFIHLLHSLVSLELVSYPPATTEDAQRLRLGLAMGIVRFVNSLVDPLQTGPYARPISHLAATLSLPPALIALRHRATHEDLPPLSLLHSALGQCISYLHHYSFLPLLSSSSSSSAAGAAVPPGMAARMEAGKKRVEGLVKRWKRVQKVRLRDKEVREEDETALEVKRIKKALQVEDAGVIVDVLIGQGGLVPIADKKRASLKSSTPPTPSLKIWLPLLRHLASTSHPDLPAVLSSRILDVLLNPGESHSRSVFGGDGIGQLFGGNVNGAESMTMKDQEQDRDSFRWGLATWLIYLWSQGQGRKQSETQTQSSLGEPVTSLEISVEDKMGSLRRLLASLLDLHEDVVIRKLYSKITNLQNSSLPASAASSSTRQANNNNLNGLMDLLPPRVDNKAEDDEPELLGLEVDADVTVDVDASRAAANEEEDMGEVGVMQVRLAQFEEMLSARKAQQSKLAGTIHPTSTSTSISNANADLNIGQADGMDEDSPSAPGWRRLTAQEWRPCPIGCVE
ncbi:hypothetical protein I317_00879 [Kwoniella heveanensis CBS 569]|nr:hypothetical protein I317_00879 [Kwoniella heveanensis CBS 569]